jgi:hypothetical protein
MPDPSDFFGGVSKGAVEQRLHEFFFSEYFPKSSQLPIDFSGDGH